MSKLINKTRLEQFATALWTKIKGRYDKAFKEAEISSRTGREKHITFKRISEQNPLKVSLEDYTRLQDKNDFKQDVSADNVAVVDNSGIGTDVGSGSKDRSLGFRRLTTDSFSDGYVDHIRINIPNIPANTAATSRWYVWAIKQGATGKNGDTVTKVICNNTVINVDTINKNSAVKKFVKIPVEDSFENGTYFIVRCVTHELEIMNSIIPEYSEDVVNMNQSQPPMQKGETINWDEGYNATGNTAIMYLYGRESIGSLSLKLKKAQADSSTYVKHSDCTAEGGQAYADKVVKLDGKGKLSESMLPAIALNEFLSVTTFSESGLANIQYQNGDIIFDSTSQKRYLCVNKKAPDFNDRFVELNAKDGVVTSINTEKGDVVLSVVEDGDNIKFKANQREIGTISSITQQEITEIIDSLS